MSIIQVLAGIGQPVDPYYEYTTLLLPGSGTNGAQNNTFLDGSTNNFTITRNGNTTQGTFSPFSQTGWGNRFNFATPDALRPSATTISNFGTGAFTVEFWINFQNTNNAGIYYGGNGGGSVFLDYYSGSLRWGISGGAIPISYAFTPTIGRWYHVAFTRSSTTDTLYIDGTSVATGSDSQNYPSDSSPYVGSWNGSTYNGTAFISNFRIVKGVTVYTGAFTPPTSPLTATQSAGTNIAAITTGQTSLLTCQSNRFVDNGQGNTGNTGFTITVNGSPSVQAFSPFNPTASWSAATYGGSGYFDGNSDWLKIDGSTAFNFGSGDFTIEGWLYPQGGATTAYTVSYSNGTASNSNFSFEIATTTTKAISGGVYIGSTGYTVTGTTTHPNEWVHFALVRSGTGSGNLKLYVNGVSEGTPASIGSSSINTLTGTTYLTISGFYNGGGTFYTGYMSNMRLVKGTAVYTGAFTPPIAPLSTSGAASASAYSSTTNVNTSFASSETSLLLNFTNAGVYDATSKNDLETVGNAQISTSVSKFGGGSIAFDGSGDYLVEPNNINYDFGSGDFTIEFWMYSSQSAAGAGIVAKRSGGGGGSTNWLVNCASGAINFYASDGSTYQISALGGGTVNNSVWHHVAVTRSGSSFKVFVDGTQVGSTGTWSGTIASTSRPLYVGVDDVSSVNYYSGYIDDLRITKGYARYTANFTPPTAAFPTL